MIRAMTPVQRLHHVLISIANDPDFRSQWRRDPAGTLAPFDLDPDDVAVLCEGSPQVLRLIGKAMGGQPTELDPIAAPRPKMTPPQPWLDAAARVHAAPQPERFDRILDLLGTIDHNVGNG